MPVTLDDLDLRLVDALRIHPRAPWSLLGDVLGVDPVTVARRWERLTESGTAWVTAYVESSGESTRRLAVVEIDCEHNDTIAVAYALADDRRTLNVFQMAGGRDIVTTVQVRDLATLSTFVGTELPAIPGVRSTRTSVCVDVPRHGSDYRNGNLTPDRQDQLETLARAARDARDPLQSVDFKIGYSLGLDGRMPIRQIADIADTSVSTVRRRLPELLTTKRLILRCDVSRTVSDRPISLTFFANAPADVLQDVTAKINRLPEVRACMVVAGPQNLILDVWLQRLSDAQRFERVLAEQSPRLQVTDRALVLRTIKHIGRVLDEDGTCIRIVHNYLGNDPTFPPAQP